jgi:hypothetical protein
MAQKVTTTLIDDLDGTPIEDGKGGTVQFGFDGTSYEIDLSDKNSEKLREALSDYVASARRVGRSSGSAKPARNTSEDLGAIREWAAANGHEVSSRGRISQSVKDAYYAANK